MSDDESAEKSVAGAGGGKEPCGKALHPALTLVQEQVESYTDLIAHLFEEDDEFRGLCDDYRDCVLYLARAQASATPNERLRKEYSALKLRLERELMHYLERADES